MEKNLSIIVSLMSEKFWELLDLNKNISIDLKFLGLHFLNLCMYITSREVDSSRFSFYSHSNNNIKPKH